MIGIEWKEDNLYTLGRTFLREVLTNMRGFEHSIVNLGETGEGVRPNYQVTFPNGRTIAFNGASHEKYGQTEVFAVARVSQPFTLAQVNLAFQQA